MLIIIFITETQQQKMIENKTADEITTCQKLYNLSTINSHESTPASVDCKSWMKEGNIILSYFSSCYHDWLEITQDLLK